jgi:hypothetical protein
MPSFYYDRIKSVAEENDFFGYDPRHVEAYMRLGHSTLDNLTESEFEAEVLIGISCIAEDGNANAEKCAQSFGL